MHVDNFLEIRRGLSNQLTSVPTIFHSLMLQMFLDTETNSMIFIFASIIIQLLKYPSIRRETFDTLGNFPSDYRKKTPYTPAH